MLQLTLRSLFNHARFLKYTDLESLEMVEINLLYK